MIEPSGAKITLHLTQANPSSRPVRPPKVPVRATGQSPLLDTHVLLGALSPVLGDANLAFQEAEPRGVRPGARCSATIAAVELCRRDSGRLDIERLDSGGGGSSTHGQT